MNVKSIVGFAVLVAGALLPILLMAAWMVLAYPLGEGTFPLAIAGFVEVPWLLVLWSLFCSDEESVQTPLRGRKR